MTQPDHSLREKATAIVLKLQQAGFGAYWVGGCVRDFLLNREPSDYDIATSARPEQIEGLFRRTIAVGRKFGVMVVVEGKHQFQVATFRAEADYRDGRHPEQVRFADAQADAMRRDFTVNGLFYDPVEQRLHDWVGGEADLRARCIRTIGSPQERFAEDHLRLLRAVRFAAQLGFTIEPATLEAIRQLGGRLKTVSAERIRDELLKLFSPPHASRGLELLDESGLLEHVLPELAPTKTCDQSPEYHPEGTVFEHLLLMLKNLPPDADPLLPWAVLLHDIAKPQTASRDPGSGAIHFYEHERLGADMAEALLERLRFPRRQIDALVKAVRCHMQFKDAPKMRKATLRRMLMRPTFPLELQLHRVDCLGSHGQLEIYDFLVEESKKMDAQPEIRPPLLTGKDLLAMGMKPGPAMGVLLNELREKQLQDELQSAAEAKEWARTRITEETGKASPKRNNRTKRKRAGS
jgi:poly(A) polymerase